MHRRFGPQLHALSRASHAVCAGKPCKLAFDGPPTLRCIPGASLGTLRTKLTDAYGNVVQSGTAHVSCCCLTCCACSCSRYLL